MKLNPQEQAMLDGEHGNATRKAMQILVALGKIYAAEAMVPVSSVQVAGVSYDNLGEAGLEFLTEMADGGGRARVLTPLNPAGMDTENWQALGISSEFAENQARVLHAFARMNIITTCSCTPYLIGNLPRFGEHIALAESSAVCYANAVLGARTNREGGPSALASALTGVTPAYGYHLDKKRRPDVTVDVRTVVEGSHAFGALGKAISERLVLAGTRPVAFIRGVPGASLEDLKSFCASLATYGGAALFHMQGITPEAGLHAPPEECLSITQADLATARESLNDSVSEEVDFVTLGCPHLTIGEIARIAELLDGRTVTREFWITTARPTKQIADRMGYTGIYPKMRSLSSPKTWDFVGGLN